MLQKLNLIMNQTLPATYDDSLSYYEALSKICYEANEIIDKINADEALIAANSEAITSINSQITSINNSLAADAEKIQLHSTQINGVLETMLHVLGQVDDLDDKINADEALIAANSEAITSINSQITSINNSLSADAEKIQLHSTQINGVLQTMQQLSGQVNDLDGEVSSSSSSITSLTTRVNSIESDFNTGFATPYITLTQELLPGSPSNRVATKAYVDSKISSEFTPIVLAGEEAGPAALAKSTVRFDKTGLIIYGSISNDELAAGGYELFSFETRNTLAAGISAWVGDALANRTIFIPIFSQTSNLDSPSFDRDRWFTLSFNNSGVLSSFAYAKTSGATTTVPNFIAQTVI